MKKLMLLVAAVAAALCVAVPAIAQDKTDSERALEPRFGSNDRTLIVGRGSDTTYDVMQALGNLYSEAPKSVNPNNDKVINAVPQGSSVGIEQLASNNPRTEFARSSRAPRDSDPAGLNFSGFALDGIVPVTFGDCVEDPEAVQAPSCGVENLTTQQLRGIFVDCTITNWLQVGGQPGEIEVFAVQEGSGTRATFDAFLGGDSSNCIDGEENIIFENNAGPIYQAENQDNAIFYFSFGRLNTGGAAQDQSVNALSVDGVDADSETIGNETFPITRDLFNVTRAKIGKKGTADFRRNQAGKRFINFICNPPNTQVPNSPGNLTYEQAVEENIQSKGFGAMDGCETSTTP